MTSPQPITEAPARPVSRIRVAECPVDAFSFHEAEVEICRRIESAIPTHVIFVNAAKVVKYQQDRSLRTAIDNADLLLADGVPVVWASRLSDSPLPGRVNGTDLMERMVAIAAEHGYRVYFLGATNEIVARVATVFRKRHPGLRVAGFHHGYFSEAENHALVEAINRSGAHILFVGMGTPQKELWGHRNRGALRVPVCQGVGGSFDVVAGLVKRAPVWMQHCGLEWFFRLIQEPRRLWSRYLATNTAFIGLVFRAVLHALRMRVRRTCESAEEPR